MCNQILTVNMDLRWFDAVLLRQIDLADPVKLVSDRLRDGAVPSSSRCGSDSDRFHDSPL